MEMIHNWRSPISSFEHPIETTHRLNRIGTSKPPPVSSPHTLPSRIGRLLQHPILLLHLDYLHSRWPPSNLDYESTCTTLAATSVSSTLVPLYRHSHLLSLRQLLFISSPTRNPDIGSLPAPRQGTGRARKVWAVYH